MTAQQRWHVLDPADQLICSEVRPHLQQISTVLGGGQKGQQRMMNTESLTAGGHPHL